MPDAQQFVEKNLNASAPAPPAPQAPRGPLRFSLLGMMVLTTVLAIVFAVVFALPPSVGSIICIFLQPCLLAACVVGALSAKGDLRAFFVGALVPFFQSLVFGGSDAGNWSNYVTGNVLQRAFAVRGTRLSQQTTVVDQMGKAYGILENLGPTLMVMMFVFMFASLCCGFTGVLVHRWVANRSAD